MTVIKNFTGKHEENLVQGYRDLFITHIHKNAYTCSMIRSDVAAIMNNGMVIPVMVFFIKDRENVNC